MTTIMHYISVFSPAHNIHDQIGSYENFRCEELMEGEVQKRRNMGFNGTQFDPVNLHVLLKLLNNEF